ncbi:hypothetical protein [Martelella alba]|uniref:Uncharacterized protein n=1 Tax=Martelella alba TaxID=2590451 RepID=A0ABY2SFB6_9HYPH|nr:hypothetical protein [Martelella alba]TKI02891.1 hypothetical protein FCN80_23560 [Martelella alba]
MAKATENATVEVVVLKGKTVHHDGTKYPQNTLITLDEESAEHLIKAGFVATRESLQAAAAEQPAAVSVSTQDNTTVQGPVETKA